MNILKHIKYLQYIKILTISLILGFIILPINKAYSQIDNQAEIDSLDNQLQNAYASKLSNKEICKIINKIYIASSYSQPYLALEYAGQALQLASEEGDLALQAEWCEKMADIYFEQKVYYMAQDNYQLSYTNYNQLNMKKESANALLNLGETYFIQGIDDFAYTNYQQAETIFQEINDIDGLVRVKNKLGIVNMAMYQYDNAEKYFNQALELSLTIKDAELIAETYSYLADYHAQNEDYDNQKELLEQAINKYRIAGNKIGVADAYFSLGEMNFNNEDYIEANTNYQSAYSIYKDFGRLRNIVNVYNRQGKINYYQERYYNAQSFANDALKIADQNFWLDEKAEALQLLSDINNKLNKVDSAYYYLTRFSEVKDSIFQTKKAENFTELQMSLATKEKEKELALAEEKVIRNRFTSIIISIISVIGAIFMFFIIRNSIRIKKGNELLKLQNDEINNQKEEIQTQKEITEKANEEIRLRNKEIEAINLDITSSINYAGRIQNAMLPGIEFIKKHFSDGFVYFHPKEVVSGDFYWFSEVKMQRPPSLFRRKNETEDESNKLIIAVIDCTGHGVPGAFMSMLGDAFLNQIINVQKIIEPNLILNELHKLVRTTLQQETTENNDGMDAGICVIDKSLHILKYAGAKCPLLYIQDGEVFKINGDLKSIGGMQKENERLFTCNEVDISKPTTFYIYSDGYQDQFGGPNDRKFMAKHFRDMLTENYQLPGNQQNEVFYKIFKEWTRDNIQMDDTTIIGIKI
ncbi:MAG: SpoIIE family protein phosphatase [Bacteroidales bacterium]|nr:SpoIIE family protein phosphatase [Bacteroidales bacterium]